MNYISGNAKHFLKKICVLACAALLIAPAPAGARSAFSPRHTGMEPPGGPKQLDSIPGASIARTPDGGFGHIDAYGNRVVDKGPEEKKTTKRLRPGAYGGYEHKEAAKPAPVRTRETQTPLWKFQ